MKYDQLPKGVWLPWSAFPEDIGTRAFVARGVFAAFELKYPNGNFYPNEYQTDPYCVFYVRDELVRWPHDENKPNQFLLLPE